MAFYGIVPEGTSGHLVNIEAQVNLNAPTNVESLDVRLIGLPQTALRQGVLRWQSALRYCGLNYPSYEVIMNLAPADLPKTGTTLDAPIACLLGILGQTAEEPEEVEDVKEKTEQDLKKLIAEIRARNSKRQALRNRVYLSDWVIIGELSLTGELRSTKSLLGMVSCSPKGAKIIVPKNAEKEASLFYFHDQTAELYAASSLKDIIAFMIGDKSLTRIHSDKDAIVYSLVDDLTRDASSYIDFKNISGQEVAKRAIEIAVAGGHSLLLYGPPGEGKTMLAKAIPGIMPKLTYKEAYEINLNYSAKGLLKEGIIKTTRPFRQVHTTATQANMIGCRGQDGCVEPGEVSLAHHGVLFLDELPQFPVAILEHLRAPLAEKKVVIGRAYGSIEFQCNFALVAAMNPCTCGYYGEYMCSKCLKTIWKQNGKCEDHPSASTIHRCHCSSASVKSYLHRLSGPFLDRIDLKVRVFSLNPEQRFMTETAEQSEVIRERVRKARLRQLDRFKNINLSVNAQLDNMQRHIHLLQFPALAKREFDRIQGEKRLSYRAAVKVLQVARTIADLEGKEEMAIDHILQAMGFMGTTFNDAELRQEYEGDTIQEDAISDPKYIDYLKNRVLGEIARRRLSKNRCAQELDMSVMTFNKFLSGETNLSRKTLDKITGWLEFSSKRSFNRGKRK